MTYAFFSSVAHIMEEVEFTCIEDHSEDTDDLNALLGQVTNDGEVMDLEEQPKR